MEQEVVLLNIHNSPDSKLQFQPWDGVIKKFDLKIIVMGDEKSHHINWGCSKIDKNGRVIYESLIDHN